MALAALSRIGVLRMTALATATMAISCSLIADFTSTQCDTDAECQALADGATCGADNVCIPPSSVTGGGGAGGSDAGCVSNQQCVDDNGQLPFMCRTPGEPCVSLLSEDCTQVFGDFRNDNAIVFGQMAPLTGAQFFIGQDYLVAAELASREFEDFLAGGGLPGGPGGTPRPIVIVACDQTADAVRAATHLVENVKVPAIQGPSFSEQLINVAANVAIPNDVFMLSGAASSPLLLDLPDPGLVWSARPNDVSLNKTYGPMLRQVEEKVRADQGLMPTDNVKMAFVVAGAAGSQAFGGPFQSEIVLNGKSAFDNGDDFLRIDYGDISEGAVDFSAVVTAVLNHEPHIITLIGGPEQYTDVLTPIEENWPMNVPRPEYALGEKLTPDLTEYTEINPELRQRVRGVQNIPDFMSFPNWQAFSLRYQQVEPSGDEPGPFDHTVYDSLYLLAYSTMAAGNVASQNLTGTQMAGGLLKLNAPGQLVNVGPEELQKGMNVLVGDVNGIDYESTEGPKEFVPEFSSPVGIGSTWCVNENNEFQSAGQTINLRTGELDGAFDCSVQ